MLSVTVPGKLVLLGEYAVLEGVPGIVAAVDRRMQVEISPRNTGSTLTLPHAEIFNWPIRSYGNGTFRSGKEADAEENQEIRYVTKVINQFRKRVAFNGSRPPAMDLLIDARPFYIDGVKLGFGSSAAATVGATSALYAHTLGRLPEPEMLLRVSQSIHWGLQDDIGSGIDVAACVHGGVLMYRLDKNSEPLMPHIDRLGFPPSLDIIAVWKGRPTSTARVLSDLKRFEHLQPSAYRQWIRALAKVSFDGANAFKDGRTSTFLHHVDRFFERLIDGSNRTGLHLVTDSDIEMAKIARRHGGVYKPSGAGGGDMGLVFLETGKALSVLRQTILNSGYRVINLKWGGSGVTF